MDAKIFRVNYKSDFILTLTSDAGWMTPFCIKFWTGSPRLAYYASYDGTTHVHCTYDPSEPTKLTVQFDDHHLPIGDLKYQVAYHFTVADFPENTEDEVTNQANVTTVIDGDTYQVMLDLNGETAPEIQFALPAYANELQRIQNEQQRIAQEQQRITQEQQRVSQEAARVVEFGQIQDQAAADHRQAVSDHGIAVDDHTRANSDHGIAVDDHTQAGNDHTRAESDHGIAVDDHTQAGNDHTRAESDHGIAVDDHTQAGNDHTRAEADHGIAVDDHTQAGNDHTRAEADHGIAVDDHARVETDLAEVEEFSNSLGAYDISAAHATGSTLATYPDLATALGPNGTNIPEALRKGGMSVKFVLTYDNNSTKYVQYRLMADDFTTDTAQWQGVDEVPTAGSKSLVQSGGVRTELDDVWHEIDGTIAVGFAQGNIDSSSGAYVNNTNRVRTSSPVNAGRDFKIVCKGDVMVNNGVLLYDATHDPSNPGEKDVNWLFLGTPEGSTTTNFKVSYDEDFPNVYVVFRRVSSSSSAITPADVVGNVSFVDSVSMEKHLNDIDDDITELGGRMTDVEGDVSDMSTALTNVQSDVDGLESNLNTVLADTGNVVTEGVQVTSGKKLEKVIPFMVPSGKTFKVELSCSDTLWNNDYLQEIDAYDENDNLIVLASSPNYKNFSQEFVAQANYKSIRLFRSSAASASGTINFTATLYSKYATKTELESAVGTLEAGITEGLAAEASVRTSEDARLESMILSDGDFVIKEVTPSFKSGKYYGSDGSLVENTGVYCDPIDISVYAGKNVDITIQLTNPGTGGRYCLITTENGTVLSENREKDATASGNIYLMPLGIIPSNGKFLLLSFTTGAANQKVVYTKKAEGGTDIKMAEAFVDAVNGSDSNSGDSWTNAFATFAKAVESTGDECTINFTGDIHEGLYLTEDTKKKRASIIGKKGTLNRIIMGTKIDSATQYSGDVYYVHLDSFPLAGLSSAYIYQWGINDADSAILNSEIHSLQRGRSNRLDCTRIYKGDSLESVVSDTKLQYYWDSTNNNLYFKIVSGSSIAENPVYIPDGSSAIAMNGGILKACNIDCYFGNFYIRDTELSHVSNCSVRYAKSAAGFQYDGSIGIVFEKCEAACIFVGDGKGDGFNAHTTTSGSATQMRHTTARLIDCWAHDVDDDGFSDHGWCESIVEGGLFEYNQKGGVVPAIGAHCIAYNVLSRRNHNGFYAGGIVEDGDGATTLVCFSCVAENNTHTNTNQGMGYRASDGAKLDLYHCRSVDNDYGFGIPKDGAGIINIFDCRASGNTQLLRDYGTINIINADIVTTTP